MANNRSQRGGLHALTPADYSKNVLDGGGRRRRRSKRRGSKKRKSRGKKGGMTNALVSLGLLGSLLAVGSKKRKSRGRRGRRTRRS